MKHAAYFAVLGALTMSLLACASDPKDVTVGKGTDALGGLGEPPKADGTCDTRLTACSGVCVELGGDESNCGACGNACSAGQSCSSGTCVTPQPPPPPPPPPIDASVPDAPACEFGSASCGGTCIPVLFDNNNCGACGVVCASGTRCLRGVCM
jgi:hypothetical protein